MTEPAPTLRSVYPDAPGDGPLKVHPAVVTSIPARTWHRFIWTLVAVGAIILASNWVIAWPIGVDRFNDLFGGTGVTYDEDGDPWALAGTWLEPVMFLGFAVAAVTYCLLRLALKPPWRRDRRVTWEQWARERGFSRLAGMPPGTTERLAVFNDGRDRDWEGPWHGQVGGHMATVGATAWTTGSGKSQQRHNIFFAYVQLSGEVAVAFPGSSLTRFLRGISDVDLDVSGDELRLESIGLDHGCEIRVSGDPDHERWRQLFDPPMMVAMHETHDVQWQHQGRHIAFCTGGSYHSRAPVETLDTLCAGAAYVCGHMTAVARRRALAARAGAHAEGL
ncbi:MAG: hypothetical protein JWM86_115 [Thermoleophilia bacterium]|nr:hypothetical protein [Thermoleophilia bacterium]